MKILFATDGTKHSAAAASMIKRLDLGEGDDIHVISVVDMAVPMAVDIYGGYLPDTSELERVAKENARKLLDDAAADLNAAFAGRNVAVSSEVEFGSPDSRIVETAESRGSDMIVIGSHGYNRWERLLLGSVSNSVVHHAHCTVMVVRSHE